MKIRKLLRRFLLKSLLLFALLAVTNSTLSKTDRKGGTTKKIVNAVPEESAYNDGDDDMDARREIPGADQQALKREILENYDRLDTGEREFQNGITLGYVTIWNNHGYDVAKWAAKKFTHIAPVWFQLKSVQIDGQLTCKVEGTHDIDMGWIEDIRKNNSDVKIVPRFLFEGWQGNDLKQFLSDEMAQQRCVRAIIDLLMRTQLDGAVMEIWLQIMAMTRGTAVDYLLELVEFWAKEFQKSDLLFILPVSPPLNANLEEVGIVNRDVIKRLLSAVDYVNVMTYDFPSPEIAGVAPIYWVEANIQYLLDSVDNEQSNAKIVMGLNFYGYDRTGGGSEAILGKKFMEVISTPNSALSFDPEAGEHRLTFGKNGIIYFPTIRSIQMRLDLANKLGIGGVAIWDIGQGLNHFTSVL